MRLTKQQLRSNRKRRIRARIFGTADRPRLSVYCSLSAVYAQFIDDTAGRTLLAGVTDGGKTIAAAKKLGTELAAKAKDRKISTVVFDRNGRRFHGRIKALADAAREGGLSF